MNSVDPGPASTDTALVYDGECPVCSAYVRLLRIREAVGPVALVNAREGGIWVDRVKAQGLDLDEGFAMYYGGRWYHGPDCIHMLSLLSTGSGVFNRLNAAIFRHPRLGRALYPILRAGRNTILWILRRSPLHLT